MDTSCTGPEVLKITQDKEEIHHIRRFRRFLAHTATFPYLMDILVDISRHGQ